MLCVPTSLPIIITWTCIYICILLGVSVYAAGGIIIDIPMHACSCNNYMHVACMHIVTCICMLHAYCNVHMDVDMHIVCAYCNAC